MQVCELKIGHRARILSIAPGHSAYRQRLMVMGLLPGSEFTVLRVAPLGDPIEIQIRGFALSLRKKEAAILQVEVI